MQKTMVVITFAIGVTGAACWVRIIAVGGNSDMGIFALTFVLGTFCTFISLVLAAIFAIRLLKKRAIVRVHTAGLLMSPLSIILMICAFYLVVVPAGRMALRGENIADIGIAVQLFVKDHSGNLPAPAAWCDSLVRDGYLTSSQLTLGSTWKRPQGYALNTGVLKCSEVPRDIVLVFESSPGWNLVGGQDLLLKDEYKGGCYVVFGNKRAEYVSPAEIAGLRWE